MFSFFRIMRWAAIVAGAIGVTACNNNGSDSSGVGSTQPSGAYIIGGSVTGVTASGLILENNGVTQPVGSGATSFTFTSGLATGATYDVVVLSAPTGFLCNVANGSGTVADASVNNIAVTCTAQTHSLGGTVSGLSTDGLVLVNNGATATLNSGATTFTFPSLIPTGTHYSVSVQTAPSGYTCSLANGVGIMGTANVANVVVTCSTQAFTVSGTINGYTTSGLQLANGAERISVATGATSFTTVPIASGSSYTITVAAQPTGLNCSVQNGAGTTAMSNVTNVVITCTDRTYTLGGTVTGLTASGLVLANGTDTVSVPVNGTRFTFPTNVAFGATFAVTVSTQPTGSLMCTVAGGSGTMPANNLNNVAVTCGPTATLGATGTMPTTNVTSVKVTCAQRLWTWMNGSNTSAASGVYGGTSPPQTPGARDGAMTWKDSSGNFWLFGGAGRDSVGATGELNDVWKYNPVTNLWTYVTGAQTANPGGGGIIPSGRQAGMVWTDSSGNAWLFGGLGIDFGAGGGTAYLLDLWEFNMSTAQWTLVGTRNEGQYGSGPGVFSGANWPAIRSAASTWTDSSGRFWMFGGTLQSQEYNDVWVFDPGKGQWAWMGGAQGFANPGGEYGTQGTGATTNYPSARYSAATWQDASGKVWLFGGAEYDAAASNPNHQDFCNDLWMFDPATGDWTWEAGSTTVSTTAGVYGTRATPATNNYPGARAGAMTWADSYGDLWMLGGYGYDSSSSQYFLNDLWVYSPGAQQWAWVDGNPSNSGFGTAGVYGQQGVGASNTQPGGRFAAGGWTDSSGRFWLFGGYGLDSAGTTPADMNDLWVY